MARYIYSPQRGPFRCATHARPTCPLCQEMCPRLFTNCKHCCVNPLCPRRTLFAPTAPAKALLCENGSHRTGRGCARSGGGGGGWGGRGAEARGRVAGEGGGSSIGVDISSSSGRKRGNNSRRANDGVRFGAVERFAVVVARGGGRDRRGAGGR